MYAVNFDIKSARNTAANPEREVRWHKHHANRAWRRQVKSMLADAAVDPDHVDDDRFNLDTIVIARSWNIC